MYTYLTYSEPTKKDMSKEQNAEYIQPFASDSMKEALRDLKRNRYFGHQVPDTRTLESEQIVDIVDKVAGNTEEGKAAATLIKARGGQRMSFELTYELLYRFQSNTEVPYFPSNFFSTAIFVPVEEKSGAFNRLDIQFSIFTSDESQTFVLDPKTNQLKPIDTEEKDKLAESLRLLQIELLNSDTYLGIQKKLLEKNVDPLIIVKTIEDVIAQKLGVRPITFACSKKLIQGVSPKTSAFDYPATLFDWRDPKTKLYRKPDLSGKAYVEQTYFGLGSNMKGIEINPDWVKKNQEEKTEEELDNDYFSARAISDQNSTWVPVIPLLENTTVEDTYSLPSEIKQLLDELITLLKDLFDKVIKSMDNTETEEQTMRFDM